MIIIDLIFTKSSIKTDHYVYVKQFVKKMKSVSAGNDMATFFKVWEWRLFSIESADSIWDKSDKIIFVHEWQIYPISSLGLTFNP